MAAPVSSSGAACRLSSSSVRVWSADGGSIPSSFRLSASSRRLVQVAPFRFEYLGRIAIG